MALENILSQEIVQQLGWTLLHFVWQATAVALVLAILLAGLRKAAPSVRYNIACAALALMVLLPILTMPLVSVSRQQLTASVEPPPAPISAPIQPTEAMASARVPEYEEPVRPESLDTAPMIPWKQRAADRLEPALPYVVSGWLWGVFGLSLWHLGGWAQLQRLRRKLIKPVDASLRAGMRELAGRLGVGRAVELLESALVQVPTVVGWLRPVILLPASALTGLSTEQLEALLAHELAHIRRCDYLVNVLQTVIETLGFYHPAVWWVSHKIRIERENCCDDMAVGICGDRIRYARALTSMEEIRSGRSEFAVAASGGNLFARIRRLVGKEVPDSSRTSWIPSALTFLLIAIMVIPTTLALTAKPESQDTQEAVDPQKVEDDAPPEGAMLTLAIVPNINRSGREPGLTNEEYLRYVDSLAHDGPFAESIRGGGFQWSPVKGDVDRFKGLPLSTYKEQAYILLCASARYVMVPKIKGRQLWGLENVQATKDMNGRPAISIQFDGIGVDFFYKLTKANIGNHLAMVVDGHVLSAPRLETALRKHAIITVDLGQQELLQLVENLQKGMLSTAAAENKTQQEQLGGILEKFSDGTTSDKTDNNAKGPLESVENYIAAALAGDDEKATEYAQPESAAATKTKDTREILQGQDIKIVAACIGERNALVISSVIQADHSRTGSVVFHLKKTILDQEVHWLIDDIDIETLDTIGNAISYFLKNVPDAKTIIIRPDAMKPGKLTSNPTEEPARSNRSGESQREQPPAASGPVVAKSPAASGGDKPQVQTVRVELSVVEVSSDSKMDRETTAEIKNLLGGKITVPDSPAAADLLRKTCEATAPVKDESAGDKQVTQEQFDKLFDVLTSRGYLKILLRPTLEVVEGQTARIKTDQNSLEVAVETVKDDAITMTIQADLRSQSTPEGNDQTPPVSTRSFSSRICINPGQRLVINGLMRPDLRTDAESNTEASQAPTKELMCILTASITTPRVIGSASDLQDGTHVKAQDRRAKSGEMENGNRPGERFELGKDIPIALATGPDGMRTIVQTRSVRFDKTDLDIRVTLRADVRRGLLFEWKTKIELLGDGGEVLCGRDCLNKARSLVSGEPVVEERLIEFAPFKWNEVSSVRRFRISLEQGGTLRDEIGRPYDDTRTDWIQGRVTGPDGQPVGDAIVLINEHKPRGGPFRVPRVGTDENGRYKFGAVDWPYRLGVERRQRLYSSGIDCYQLVFLKPIFNGPQTVDFKFDELPKGSASLTGLVVDADGVPIREFKANVMEYNDSEQTDSESADVSHLESIWYNQEVNSEKGEFRLENVPAGKYRIRIVPKEKQYERRNQEVVLADGKATNLTLAVPSRHVLYGRVLFEDGSPAVLRPAPWPGAETQILLSMGHSARGVATVAEDGYFAVYFDESELEQLKSGPSQLIINVPTTEQGRRVTAGRFPFELLTTRKDKAGIVKVNRPAIPKAGAAAEPNEPTLEGANKNQVVQKFFKLKYYSASDAAQTVRPLLGKTGYVSADEKTNTLLIVDTVENLKRIEEIIAGLDVPQAAQTITQIFEIRYGDPSEMVESLKKALSIKTDASSVTSATTEPGGQPIVFIPEPRRKWIIAKASVEDMKQVRRWIEQLDADKEYEVVQLRYVDANETAERITKVLSQLPEKELRPSVPILPLEQTGQIVIFGKPDMREIVKKLIAQWDTASSGLETGREDFGVFRPRIIKLENCDPAEMAKLMTALFAEDKGDWVNISDAILGENAQRKPDIAGPLGSHFTFEDVPGTNAIIVISNIPEAYEAVERLVVQLDKQKMAGKDVNQAREWIARLVRKGPLRAPENQTTISGQCLDAGGQPLSNALVQVYCRDSGQISITHVAESRTDSAGRFTLGPITAPGEEDWGHKSYFVFVPAEDHGPAWKDVNLYQETVEPLELTACNWTTVSGSVVTEDSKPVAGAHVWVRGIVSGETAEEPSSPVSRFSMHWPLPGWSAITDSNGSFRIAGIPDGTRIQLFVSHRDFAGSIVHVKAGAHAKIELQPAAVITGRVLYGKTGKPAVGVVIGAQSVKTISIPAGWMATGGWAVTDKQGRYRLESLPAGKYNVSAKAENLTVVALDSFEVKAGEVREAPDLVFIEGGFIAGRVIDEATGKPVKPGQHSNVAIYGPSHPKSGAAVEISEIREDGSFRIRVAPGSNYIYLRPGEDWGMGRINLRSPWVDVAEGQTVEVEFKVRKVSAEELEKERAPWQALNSHVPQTIDELERSADRLKQLGLAIAMYATEHDDTLPDGLQQLKGDVQDQVLFRWLLENVEYMGKGKILQPNAARTPIAYDRTLLQRAYSDYSTEVLFLDSSVRFVGAPELGDLGITRPRRPTQTKPDTSNLKQSGLTEVEILAKDAKTGESARRLSSIGRAMLAYAKDHEGTYPARVRVDELREYLKTEERAWPRQYEYLAEGRTTKDRSDIVIYYDAQLFERGKGTNVLLNDGHVEFVGPERLNELNINKTQILIETRILEATDDFLKENRLDANSVRTGKIRSVYPIAESAAEPNSLPYCLIFDDLDVDLLLKATATPQGQHTKMMTAPQVLALDGRPVTMKISTHLLPVPAPSNPNDASGKTESKPQYAEIGTSIKITPDALPDGNSVLLDFEWELSQVRGYEQQVGPDGKKQKFPLIVSDNIKTTAMVPDGKTLLIGGKKIRRWIVTTTKKPLLGDLPLVGSLFRSESRVEEARNVLILIKPTVIAAAAER
jgi:type II secretory pathway component GspD/PulD (secretin)/beta-lactamase regulating signal transducer with metallopeptidase domain